MITCWIRLLLTHPYRDWKKLTFYYFADAYINFNSLVTDLFKIYKTRIWMSAINPASFVTPNTGLQQPSAIGPGSLGAGRDSPSERRRQAEYKSYGLGQLQGSPSALAGLSDNNRDFVSGQVPGLRTPYMNPYQSFNPAMRYPGLGLTAYGQEMHPPHDPFSAYPPASYSILSPSLSEYNTSPGPAANGGRRGPSSGADLLNGFHGLSLGSQ